MSIDRGMDKEDMVYIDIYRYRYTHTHNGVLQSHKKNKIILIAST